MIGSWAKMTTKNKLIVMSLGIFIVGFLAGWKFLISPDMKTLRKLNVDIRGVTEKKQSLFEISQLEGRIKGYQTFVSKSKEEDWLMEVVNRAAGEASLVLLSAAPQPLKEDADYHQIALVTEVGGGYHALGKFIEKIENHEPMIRIDRLRVEPQKNEQGKAMGIRATISLSAYYPAGGPTP